VIARIGLVGLQMARHFCFALCGRSGASRHLHPDAILGIPGGSRPPGHLSPRHTAQAFAGDQPPENRSAEKLMSAF
jgi:hypothetical protein